MVAGSGKRARARDDERGSYEASRHWGTDTATTGAAVFGAINPIAPRATTATQSHRYQHPLSVYEALFPEVRP
jgi:hypothetical protein